MKNIGLLVVLTLALGACAKSNDNYGKFSEGYICRAAVSAMMGRDIGIISAEPAEEDSVMVSYQRSDGSSWNLECKIEGASISWKTKAGPWRDRQGDAEVSWSLEDSGSTLVITEQYPDGETITSKFIAGDEKASYAIGYRTGQQMQTQMNEMDLEAFISGMRDGVTGEVSKDAPVSPEKIDKVIQDYQKRKMEEMKAEREQEATKNKEKGEAFLEKNAAKEGVTVLDSGLQYEVLASGPEDGVSPGIEDTVVAHYHGTTVDGEVFDSSVERGEPATFELNKVIEGWQKALPLMSVGDKWKLVIPPELAYGERRASRTIGPNETLIFEVELLEVKKAGEEEAAGEEAEEAAE